MSVTEQNIEIFKNDLRALVERFEKENGLFVLDIKYDGFSKKVNCAITGGNPKFINA